uniref:GTF3C1 extended winged-helix domain-containing protein n=1 Tax=Pristionchus pacificus TaxID=54126 RepID=A0A8R1U8L7_PRIPA
MQMGGKRVKPTTKIGTASKRLRLDSNWSEEIPSDKDDDFDARHMHGDSSGDEGTRHQNIFCKKRNKITSSEKAQMLNEPTGDIENLTVSHYLPYSSDWSPQYLFRLSTDIVGQSIRESGGEGMGRNEMARRLRIDATTKGGNRRVSANIQTLVKLYPHNIGQFQKMEGKVRTIRYFWKEGTEPEKFTQLYEEMEALIGRPCPFKMGQIIKFPESGLNTLRLSDVSLTRLLTVVQLTETMRVIVTIHKMMKLVQQIEESKGYPYQVDKKSMMKVLIALERQGLIRVYNKEVGEEKITIVAHRDIDDGDGNEVVDGIKASVEEYNREARIFPHGQYRLGTKVLKAAGLKEEAEKEEEQLLNDLEAHLKECGSIGIKDRYEMFRVQANRLANEESTKKERSKKRGQESDSDENDEEEVDKSERWREEEDEERDDVDDSDEDEEKEEKDEGAKITKRSIDRGNQLGYQPKMIRYMIIHEVAFQLTRGSQSERPTLFDRFPPGRLVNEWKEIEYDDIPVMVDEESPLRFIPQCRYEERQPGWFMVQDLMAVLPLSLFVLVCKPNGVIPKWKIMEYLNHPFRRHILVGDLPKKLRYTLMSDKRVAKQVEHICIMLSHMGLMSIGGNGTHHRFVSSFTTMFYVSARGQLYDTSPSEKGFQYVTPPLSRYNRYDYSFEHISDVYTYWHHLRAIVASTRLSFRSSVETEGSSLTGRAFSIGTVDRTPVSHSIEEAEEGVEPIGSRDGCAGFTAKICIHLSRHWEPNVRPHSIVSWFISRYRRHTESMKGIIEERVERIEKQWNSFVRSLMPSDLELLKTKKATAKKEIVETTMNIRSGSALSLEPKKQKRADGGGISKSLTKKRPLDPVDILSEKNKMHVRSRFNSRERDMLILIRAVGFFLNPVYRFWLNPAVLRDIMHEHVPESRSKTVQSLMAAGVREMVRPHRLAYLQRIVRNLSTFPEMRSLRLDLASNPLTTLEAKTAFFTNAFSVANRLFESQCMPGVSSSDNVFDKYLCHSKVKISSESSGVNVRPARSRTPTSIESLSSCLATNLLMGTLIQSSTSAHSEKMVDQVSANILHQALHIFRSDGLVSRVRSNDPLSAKFNHKSNATLSYYFRTFFSHRFHPDIIDLTYQKLERIQSGKYTHIIDDDVGVIIASLGAFHAKKEILLSVDDSILINFECGIVENDQQSVTKQIRYLEGANLQLERIEVALESGKESVEEKDEIGCEWIDSMMRRSFTLPKSIPTIDDVVDGETSNEAELIRKVYECLNEADFNGISSEKIEEKIGMERAKLLKTLEIMRKKSFIFGGGIDEKRWILMRYAVEWTIELDGYRHLPRPWTLPNGSVCLSTLRWMAESVLVAIVAQPAITTESLRFRFEFVLQPICVTELITLLEEAKCVETKCRRLEELRMDNPFDEMKAKSMVTYILPSIDALERFATIFGKIPLISTAMEEC